MKIKMNIGLLVIILASSCKKDDLQTSNKSVEQQKIEYQQRQLEIEKQKLAIEKERLAYETNRVRDSIKKSDEKSKVLVFSRSQSNDVPTPKTSNTKNREAPNPENGHINQSVNQGMSKASKGVLIGTISGATAGALINKSNRGAGAVVGGVVGGVAGYTIGRAEDKKDAKVSEK